MRFLKNDALKFVVLLGFVSLFADMTYEGARSITGQYLALLGATGTIVGFISGIGQLLGYGVRLLAGYISDKTGRYWLIASLGYLINLLAVPLLGLANHWEVAALLMIIERLGKGIRAPAKDAMLSYASQKIGRGWGFGLHEALDQIGAILGPLIVSYALYFQHGYQASFLMLAIPAFMALMVLAAARYSYPNPQHLEIKLNGFHVDSFSKKYWVYIAAVSFIALGFIDFPLIAYHFKKESIISDMWVPVLFSLAMGADGLSALIAGHLYDKKGIVVLIYITCFSSIFAPLLFLGNIYLIVIGVILWGIALGAQESIMRAYIANLAHKNKRGTAYGMFNLCFGCAWFFGSVLMGMIYDISIPLVAIVSFIFQLISLPFFIALKKDQSLRD